ncbi:hypothetical protein O6H91_05G042300 [Diphasiastrum complanatum]|uniref:Uncharacterized protein n=1 Tax=Diphasiastrum complanatum TaxID=34168 RepID=A0ACC2DMI0_DIPCM|nr:hypothetical protein O6H91_05G042300 [Diphasiastrum complanatum]
MMMEHRRILVLYASQTGNAQDVAERIGREALRRHYHPVVLSLSSYEPHWLPNENMVIFVTSTTGQGDPPDAFKSFWKFMLQRSLTNKWLEGVQYGLFGLGDSGYQKYNVVAKKLDRRLLDLGAKFIVLKGLGDDQHPLGYEAALDPWLDSLWLALGEHIPFPSGFSDVETENACLNQLDPPKYRIIYYPNETSRLYGASADFHINLRDIWDEHEKARTMVESASGPLPVSLVCGSESYGHVRHQPIFSRVLCNVRLTEEDHEQDVRHIEFDLRGSGVQYSPGDVIGMMPIQNAKTVEDFLKRCDLDPDVFVSVESTGMVFPSSGGNNVNIGEMSPVRIRSFVESVMDVDSASPRRYLFEVMSHFAKAEHEKERLQYFSSPEGRDDLYRYNQRERRTLLEILQDFPSVQLPLEWLLQLAPRLQPRYFSISSSLKLHPNEAHITVAVVSWITPYKRKKTGLCSSWLSRLQPKQDVIPIWMTRGTFKHPPASVPLILVGPGTGCAPFHAFVEERVAIAATEPVAPVLFFFGCRKQAKDYLYKEFWLSCTKEDGIMSDKMGGGFVVAFSRDQPHKIYVQHKILEEREKIWNLLSSGGSVFVAGSANKMPEDVASAFKDVILREKKCSEVSAASFMKQFERLGRYNVEVWS